MSDSGTDSDEELMSIYLLMKAAQAVVKYATPLYFKIPYHMSALSRECRGLPWGFSGQPAPLPAKTHTHSYGYGFLQVRVAGFIKPIPYGPAWVWGFNSKNQ
jgi:hypothetical protein